ncbi:MAG TPA: hypothetical protein DDX19_04185 [Rhodopirellula baltica]|uniref:Secreted protein n=3 Tax=Rhodopirellula baltica TaxID=265606 RepID=K5DJ31_RHOBT|nr:hypothetical protein RBSH_01875 [Rhodopirellula baltica SH28]ELP34454.1 hypothetical protein RBSWK_01637 [Rhodopirellula baltica SWK14]HBE61966.1 hypothetical protein [Rhodopirellula baltica]
MDGLMKTWMLTFGMLCLLVAPLGCDSGSNSNIVDNSDAEKLAEYEAALAEADAMSEGYEGTK